MVRRDFLKMSSMATISSIGTWTVVSKVFAQSPSQSKDYQK